MSEGECTGRMRPFSNFRYKKIFGRTYVIRNIGQRGGGSGRGGGVCVFNFLESVYKKKLF